MPPHHAGDADVGGPGFGDGQVAQENKRLRMERDILKNLTAVFAGTRHELPLH